MTPFIVAFIVQFYFYRYKREFWEKYVRIICIAFDSAVALVAIISPMMRTLNVVDNVGPLNPAAELDYYCRNISNVGVTVSHVTGLVSRVAISTFAEDFETFVLVTSVLLSFMFGCFIAGFIVGDHKFTLGAPYGVCLAIESGALFASYLFLSQEFILGEWCAAFACGLQNAMVTSFSGMAVRTTHMTGLVTDIGNILGQSCRSDSKAELWRLKIHVPIFIGFLVGGFFGNLGWLWFRECALFVPVIFTGGASFVYFSLPFVKDAAKKLQDDVLPEIIPGLEKPFEKTGEVNHALNTYQSKLNTDMKNFLADIETDKANVIELQTVPASKKTNEAEYDESSRLI
ncbi:hypothetical protein HDV06_000548 [Boothiomyces sp. JEL0866]|nr:hypothetical protein HDV06_000548 [Boothiomyces sp. JEL0866]